jgi:hypothetical protein
MREIEEKAQTEKLSNRDMKVRSKYIEYFFVFAKKQTLLFI